MLSESLTECDRGISTKSRRIFVPRTGFEVHFGGVFDVPRGGLEVDSCPLEVFWAAT